MKNTPIRVCLSLFFLYSCVFSVSAKPVLPPLFSSNMVFQQNTDAPVWGTSAPGLEIRLTPSWKGRPVVVKADSDGFWKTTLRTPAAGGPFTLTISDGEAVTLSNVMVGEVWICSGQSNMQMPLAGWGKVLRYEQEIAVSANKNIRLFQITREVNVRPSNVVHPTTKTWEVCAPKSVENFSAVAYFYARELQNKLKVPVGVIDVSYGGTIVEAWTSGSSLDQVPAFAERLDVVRKAPTDPRELELKYQREMKAWNQHLWDLDKGHSGENAVWAACDLDDASWKGMSVPSFIEDVCLPNFDGVLWFRRKVELGDAFLTGDLQLSLGPIDDEDVCYFNGVEIGHTSSYNVNRLYTVPKNLLKKGTNVIALRVTDSGSNGGIYGKKDQLFLTNGISRIDLCGVWKYQVSIDKKQIPVAPVLLTNQPNYPTLLFNAMIHPLIPFAMKGVIWYQGESNADRAYQYRDLFPLLIRDWRLQWGKDFPFYFVQLANYKQRSDKPCEDEWAELREAQLKALSVEKTGMAVTTDIGDANNIHPKNKQEVARRLSLIALSNSYARNVLFSGPVYKSFRINGSTIRVSFDFIDGGLMAKGGELKGFTIAGPDHKFYPAKAVIKENRVVVSASEVPFPVAVRYAWQANPECSLYNKANLPASPFRTDDWPGMTINAK